MAKDAMGGTELMMRALYDGRIARELLQEYQIIPGRITELKPDKLRILYLHDLPNDPESAHLADGGWSKFHKLVFVSQYQMQAYISHFSIPWSKCVVMQNAIKPLEMKSNSMDKIKLIYHSTPHRGLNLLYPVFAKLAEEDPNIELNVYSSFGLYGWKDRDENYKELFDAIKAHPQCNYYGSVSNDEVRKAISESHIFAYPSVWPETSCLCLMEAMSAGIVCVHPNLAALPETAANWTMMYQWQDDMNTHANVFYGCLASTIDLLRRDAENTPLRVANQKAYADLFYGWELRTRQWTALLQSMINEPREIKEAYGEMFSVDTNAAA